MTADPGTYSDFVDDGIVSSDITRIWGARIRLVAAVSALVLALVGLPVTPVLFGLLAGYLGFAGVALVWARDKRWPAWHLRVYLVLDLGAVSLGVYAFGVNTIIAAFFFPLVAGYVLSWGARVGLVTMVLSLVVYSGLVLLQRYAVLPPAPLAPVPAPPAGPAYYGLTPIPLFMLASAGVFFFLHYSIRRIRRQNEILRQNLVAAGEAEVRQRVLQERLAEVQRLESLGRLAGGVAHDFNNMLTAIQGYAELLKEAVADDPESLEDLDEVLRATGQAADLTQQLLAFSRKQVVRPRVLDFCRLVKGLERMLVRVIGEDVDFRVNVGQECCRVKADGTQLEQLIVNLVVNSRDALPTGGSIVVEAKPVQVSEAAAQPLDLPAGGEYVLLTVRDSGMGMDADTLERIFEPFYTTKEKGRGTGLGLATVYGVIKQHGGGVRVSSAWGRGTTFRVYFPRTNEEIEGRADAAAVDAGGDETLLVVEDEPTLRRLVERVLTRAGYQVHTAPDGAAALELLEAHGESVDLLLTDVVMPGMSGRQLVREVIGRFPDMRVLYMSGYTDGAMVDDGGLLAEDVSLLEKPFREAVLLEAIRAVLERGQWRQAVDVGAGADQAS
jgi:signal transduction histidine kinase